MATSCRWITAFTVGHSHVAWPRLCMWISAFMWGTVQWWLESGYKCPCFHVQLVADTVMIWQWQCESLLSLQFDCDRIAAFLAGTVTSWQWLHASALGYSDTVTTGSSKQGLYFCCKVSVFVLRTDFIGYMCLPLAVQTQWWLDRRFKARLVFLLQSISVCPRNRFYMSQCRLRLTKRCPWKYCNICNFFFF